MAGVVHPASALVAVGGQHVLREQVFVQAVEEPDIHWHEHQWGEAERAT